MKRTSDVSVVNKMVTIADLQILWQEDRVSFVKDFWSETDCTPVMSINFSDNLSSCHSVQYTDCVSECFLRSKRGDILLANSDWTQATSFFLPEKDSDFTLPLAALCSRFSFFDTLLVHASFVKYQDNGIIFTGCSGVGKTTQAELWKEFLGADIVNGDKTFLREVNDEFFAYGLPWKGSSEYCLNDKAPLRGIVVLRQSNVNRIMKIDDVATDVFMPHVFFPHWDKTCLNNALSTFDMLIRNVPVWLLECRPDEEAVKITRDAIFG